MKDKMPAVITFRTKLGSIINADGHSQPVVDYKRKVTRKDCDLRACEHDYYNADMFPSMLQRAYEKAIEGRPWSWLTSLPPAVTVDASAFLATVTVRIEV